MSKIIVVGSSNTDMVVHTSHLPVPGETILGGKFLMNQKNRLYLINAFIFLLFYPFRNASLRSINAFTAATEAAERNPSAGVCRQ